MSGRGGAGKDARAGASYGEFVAMMGMMSALVALSIDAMLPALVGIAGDLGVPDPNSRQLVITVLFAGFAVSQLIFGPLSDAIGRRRSIFIGVGVFAVGCFVSMLATDFNTMLIGRALQGVGAAGPRVVTVAVIRDRYEGREMAKIVSLVMSIFILVPVFAPSLGQAVLLIAPWRAIFGCLLVMALSICTWYALRQPETLPPERRRPFSARAIFGAMLEVLGDRVALGYTVVSGLVFGAFIGYLNSSQQLLGELYGLGEMFPIAFGGLAMMVGAASYFNSRLVMLYGMRMLTTCGLIGMCAASLAFLPLALATGGTPPFWMSFAYFSATFFAIGMLFGNFNALALERLGHIAGSASAVVGSVSTLIAATLGGILGEAYNQTVLPITFGFAVLAAAGLAVALWTNREREVAREKRRLGRRGK